MTGPSRAGFPHFVSIGKNFTAGFSFLPLLLRLAFPAPLRIVSSQSAWGTEDFCAVA
jgi:hypothetical protein